MTEAKRVKTWWRAHRKAAPDLFETELRAALARIVAAPEIGVIYERGDFDVVVRRVLLPKSLHHVYYAVTATEVVVLSVWGACRGRGPKP